MAEARVHQSSSSLFFIPRGAHAGGNALPVHLVEQCVHTGVLVLHGNGLGLLLLMLGMLRLLLKVVKMPRRSTMPARCAEVLRVAN